MDVLQRLILQAEVGDTKKKLQDVRKEQKKLSEELLKSGKATDKVSDEYKETTEQIDKLILKERVLANQLSKTNRQLDAQSGSLNNVQGRAQTRRQRGARLTEVGREIRNLPSVQIPGLGIGTDAVGNIGRVLGSLGVTFSTLATTVLPAVAGIAAVAGGFILLKNAAEEAAEAQRKELAAKLEASDLAFSGATSSDIDEQLRKIEAQRQALQENIRDAREGEATAESSGRVLARGFVKGIGDVLTAPRRAFDDLIDTNDGYQDTIEQNSEAISELDLKEQALLDQRESSTVAANDAAEAEKKLAQERSKALLEESALAGTLETARLRAAELGIDAVEDEIDALQDRKTALEAELQVLQASGDTSEAVANKIASLTSQIGSLGQQADIFKGERGAAQGRTNAEEAAKEREKARQEAERESEQAFDQAQKAQERYTESVRKSGQQLRDAFQDINRDLADTLADIDRDFQDELIDLRTGFNRTEQKVARDNFRELERLRDDFADNERDALRGRDFLALADIRQERAKAETEFAEDQKAESQERLIDLRQDLQDASLARQLEQRDAQINRNLARRDARIAQSLQLRDAQNAYNQMNQISRSGLNQLVQNVQTAFESIVNITNRDRSPAQLRAQTNETLRTGFTVRSFSGAVR